MVIGIALIRGINVGGKGLLPMQRLRSLCEGIGLHDTRTYIQSGNVVFRAPKKRWGDIGRKLGLAIERSQGFRPAVIVRTRDELLACAAENPFARRAGVDPARQHVMFLADEPTDAAASAVADLAREPDEVRVVRREIYLWLPNGVSGAKTPMATLERAAGVPGTARNMNTIQKLIAMGEETGRTK